MDYQAFRLKAVKFMLNRGWKKLIAKRRSFEQSLFDHTLIEIDALITMLPLFQQTYSPPLTELTITHKSSEVVFVYVGAKNYRSIRHCVKGERCQKYLLTAATLAR